MAFIDPVCGMTVAEEDAPRATYDSAEYRFCCEMCRLAFIGDPERFLSPPSGPHTVIESGGGHRDLL